VKNVKNKATVLFISAVAVNGNTTSVI